MGSPVLANGVLNIGFGAEDAGAAGVFGGISGDALAAMQTNPAALSALEGNEWTVSLRGGLASGDFDTAGGRYEMDVFGGFPEAAVAWRPDGGAVTFGLSMAPLAIGVAEWNYPDAPGGIGGVSYGRLPHDSGFLSVRANAGLAWEVVPGFSIGASVGALYSRVDFDAPFIFQTNPALAGAKVDLDMTTDGWSPVAEIGLLWEPAEGWAVALRARPQVELNLKGDATADFSAQLPALGLGGTPPYARYAAATGNAMPAVVGGGVSWQATDRARFGLWVDWIGWESAFDDLEVVLSGGTNAAINGAIGANPTDRVPVGWKDSWVMGLGSEYDIGSGWSVRGGWRWGGSPAPTALVTPLNASIMEHTLAMGLGWSNECWRLDLSYGFQFGDTERVFASGYRSGEYSATKVRLTSHSIGIGVARSF